MKIFPGMHYSMGGLWVDAARKTNVPGPFAAGEVDYQFHGANRLGANSLLSCLFSGQIAGPAMVAHAAGQATAPADRIFEQEARRQQRAYDRIIAMDGPESAYLLARESGDWMTAIDTVIRDNLKLA